MHTRRSLSSSQNQLFQPQDSLQAGTSCPCFTENDQVSASLTCRRSWSQTSVTQDSGRGALAQRVVQPGCASVHLRVQAGYRCFNPGAVLMPFAHFTIGLFVFFSLISHDMLHVKNSKLCLFWLLTFSLWKLFIPTLQPSFLLIRSVGTWARGGVPHTRPYVPRTRGRLASRVSDAAGGSATEPRRSAVRPRGWEGGKCKLIRDRPPLPWLSCQGSFSVMSASPPTRSGFYRLGWFQQG